MGGFRALTRVKSETKPRFNRFNDKKPENKRADTPNYLQFVKLNDE